MVDIFQLTERAAAAPATPADPDAAAPAARAAPSESITPAEHEAAPSTTTTDPEKRQFCAGHAEEMMVDLNSKKCSHTGCRNIPSYAVAGTKKGVFCAGHAEDGMAAVTAGPISDRVACVAAVLRQLNRTAPGGCTRPRAAAVAAATRAPITAPKYAETWRTPFHRPPWRRLARPGWDRRALATTSTEPQRRRPGASSAKTPGTLQMKATVMTPPRPPM